MTILNKAEIHALQYYEGVLTKTDTNPFWCDSKAYVTFNSLFFDGLETETARSCENRRLNPAVAGDTKNVLELTRNLIQACWKYPHGTQHVFRVERLVDYRKFQEAGVFTSFISTSRNGYLPSYEDKYDLVLMDIEISSRAVCIDLAEMLPSNEKTSEGEVLIAPYASIELQEEKLPMSLSKITDGNGNPPAVYCHVKVGPCTLKPSEIDDEAFSEEKICAVQNVYAALNMHASPNIEDVAQYLQYKQAIRQKVLSIG